MRKLLYIVVIAALFIGCKDNRKFDAALDVADTLMRNQPDSAYRMLLSMSDDAAERSEARRMRQNLLLADAQNKAYIDFTTDSVMLKVAEYYDRHGSANEQMRAHYLLGCTYRDLHDVPMELQCFLDAVEKADTTQKDCDLYTLAAIYGQMSQLYHSQHLPQEEMKAIDNFENISWMLKDTVSALLGYELHFSPYLITNQNDSIVAVLTRAIDFYNRYGYKENAARASVTIINEKITEEDYDGVKEMLDVYEKESNLFDKDGNIEHGRELYYYYKGKYVQDCENNIDEAIKLYNKAIDGKFYLEGYRGLMSVYQKIGNPDSIKKYCKLYTDSQDSIYNQMVTTNIEQMTAMYDYSRHKFNAEKNINKGRKLERILSTGILLFIIFTTISFLVFYIYKKEKEKKIASITIAYINTMKTKEALIQEIESLNNTLIVELNTHKISQRKLETELSEKKLLMQTLQKQIDFYNNELKGEEHSNMLIAFKETEIYNKLELCKHYKNGSVLLTAGDWKKLYGLFKQYFPKYYSFIQSHETLTSDEVKTCVLIRLGFRAIDIAHILGKQKNQITNTRASINNKIFANSGASTLDNSLSYYF